MKCKIFPIFTLCDIIFTQSILSTYSACQNKRVLILLFPLRLISHFNNLLQLVLVRWNYTQNVVVYVAQLVTHNTSNDELNKEHIVKDILQNNKNIRENRKRESLFETRKTIVLQLFIFCLSKNCKPKYEFLFYSKY